MPVEFKLQQPRLPHGEARPQRCVIVIILIATDFTERNRGTGLSADVIGHQRAGDRTPPAGVSAFPLLNQVQKLRSTPVTFVRQSKTILRRNPSAMASGIPDPGPKLAQNPAPLPRIYV